MYNANTYIGQIKESLAELNPYLIILFGSYASGTPNENSDIDLLVVTNDDYLPGNFEEHSKLFLKVSKVLRQVKKQIAIDLIVQTIPMYHKFIEQNSSFSYEIVNKGKVLYESNH